MSNPYVYVALTLLFTVYGQLVLKWRIVKYGALPNDILSKLTFLMKLFLDPYILSGFFAAFLASLFWMAAMTKLEVTKAYPAMSLAPALVFIFGIWFFQEEYTHGKIVGLILIALGVFITVKF